jgi:1,2-dihydroxy-3-keto-5-methylthiopentene dioxygenase
LGQGDSRLPHNSGVELSIQHLETLGVLYYNLPPDSPSSTPELNKIAATRGYVSRDELVLSPDTLGGPAAYENILKKFFEEHFHHDEEIRYVLEGTGYFDVRDQEDRWIRFRVDPGDLVVLPAGIYHRFTLGEQNVCQGSLLPTLLY